MLNSVALVGRLTADPELRTTTSGKSVTSFTLAVNRNYVAKGKERECDFIDCVAWAGTAEFVVRYFKRGSTLGIGGNLRTRMYEDKQGNKRKAVEVEVREACFVTGKDDGRKPQEYTPQVVEPSEEDETLILDDDDLPF